MVDRKVIKAAILAAGRGSRLRSLTENVPKALIAICGVPLIDRLISILEQVAINEVICVVGYKSDMIKKHLEGRKSPLSIRFKKCHVISSKHSFSRLKGEFREHFLLCNVDSLFAPEEFFGFMDWIRSAKMKIDIALLVTTKVLDESPLEVVVDKDNRILRMGKNIVNATHYCAGVGVFTPKIFREMSKAKGKAAEHLSEFLGFLVYRGYDAFAYEIPKAYDVDNCEDLKEAEIFIKRVDRC